MDSVARRVLLDTNILIALSSHTEKRPQLDDIGICSISSLSLAELVRGLYVAPSVHEYRRRALTLQRVKNRFGAGIPFDDSCLEAYDRIVSALSAARRGLRAHTIDRMIAATALNHDLAIVTRDRSGFAGIEDLVEVIER